MHARWPEGLRRLRAEAFPTAAIVSRERSPSGRCLKHFPSFPLLPSQIYAVRSVVPNKSNNEIVLVLQQFDFNVDKAVQAFVDGECGRTRDVRAACPGLPYGFLSALNTHSLLMLSHENRQVGRHTDIPNKNTT